MNLIGVVGVRSYGTGSQYLLIPSQLAKMLGLKDGDNFACYLDGENIHYQKMRPVKAEKVEALEVQA